MDTTPRRGFRQVIRHRLRRWQERHRHPFNYWMHVLGIPLAAYGVLKCCQGRWDLGVTLLVAGYGLQFLGHLVEGNDLGEWALIKWVLGWPCVPISPRWQTAGPLSQAPPFSQPSRPPA